ncbi:GNAT family N-acyltransferase [Novilysobacter arseniciresistens]|uniref:GNAT family N-acyltransferase n=1 Tax=Novilysobacter arseniciresistens TaxID=1385522 RepID=UPI000ABB447E|nr:GNAT family N-acyltransferase [Lysobacter arseniciresistens]
MLQLQARVQARFPRWFEGRRAHLARPLLRTLGRWSRFDALERFIAGNAHLQGQDFVRAALEYLQVHYRLDDSELGRIPAHGPLVVVANHPSGALDALALLDALGRVRSDVRVVANDLLWCLEGLRPLLLPVRILGGRPGVESLRAIDAALGAGQCVVVFPAGEVARMGWRGVTDGRWQRGFLRFACGCGAPVVPVHIRARNSALFYGASAVFRPAGTALLAREMFERRSRPLALRIGWPMQLPPTGDPRRQLREVRAALQALGRGPQARTPAVATRPRPVAAAEDPAALGIAILGLELLGRTADGMQIRAGRLDAGNPLMREIGRLRESTFRAVGEGTGRARDVDAFDGWYEHIVLWDEQAARVAGAYRVARGAPVLASRGLDGLYTASLFRYADDAIPRLAAGMELGRSFVAPEYWGGRSIDYLWQGIGAYLARHRNVRYLFGAVSISNALPVAAREQIVAYYAQHHGSERRDVESMRPFRYRAAPPRFDHLDVATGFQVLRANLDALGATLPMLYKQYTELCEPGGARFLAFGVDPGFGDAVDGLIEVDIERMRPRKRARYLGRAAESVAAAGGDAR